MDAKEILAYRRANSNIAPIARMGRPVKSIKTRYAELMPKNDTRLGFLKHGDLVSGLTGAVQGFLGFSRAKQDALNEMAYYDYLAKQAEQERQDKLAQQAWEQDYKERALAQDLEKAKLAIDADKAKAALLREQALQDAAVKRAQAIEDRNAQYAHERSMYDRNRANAVADRQAEAEAKAYAQYLSDMNAQAAKNLTAGDYAKWRENPSAYDIDGRGWWGRKFGVRSSLIPKVTSANFGVNSQQAGIDPLAIMPIDVYEGK